jgi:hypothetical protein
VGAEGRFGRRRRPRSRPGARLGLAFRAGGGGELQEVAVERLGRGAVLVVADEEVADDFAGS